MGDLGGAFAAFESAAAVVKRDFHGGMCDTLNAMAGQVSGLMGSFSGFCAQGKAEAAAQAHRLKTLFPRGMDGLDDEMRNFEREIGWNERTGSFVPVGSPAPSSSGATSLAAGRMATASIHTVPASVLAPPSRTYASPSLSGALSSRSGSASPSAAPIPSTKPSSAISHFAMTTSHSPSPSASSPVVPADAASQKLADKYRKAWEEAFCKHLNPNPAQLTSFQICGGASTLRGQVGQALDELARIAAELNRLSMTRLDKRAVDAKNCELASLGTQLQFQRRLVEGCLGDLPNNDSWMASVRGNLDLAQKELSDVEAWLKNRPAWAEERRHAVDGFRKRFAQISGDRTALESRLKRQKASCDRIAQAISSLQSSLSNVAAAENARVAKIASEKARGEALCRDAGNAYRKLNPKTVLRFSLAQSGGRWVSSPSKAEFLRELTAFEAPLVSRIEAAAKQVCELQKRVDVLSPIDLNSTDAFPSFVIVDSCRITVAGRSIELPIPNRFPYFSKPRYFKNTSEIEPFLLRLICALPVGSVQITMLDIEKKGDNGRVFNSLAKAGQKVFRLVTDIGDVYAVLKEHGSYIASLASSGKFTATVGDWAAYNASHPRNPLPFRILVVHSIHGWDERDVDELADLFVRGPDSGVHVFFALDGMETLDDRARAKVEAWTLKATTSPVDVVKWAKDGGVLKPTRIPMRLPSPSQVERILDAYADLCAKRSVRAAHVFADLFEGTPQWAASTAAGLEAVMGWDEAGDPVVLRLGGNKIHALIGGETGGGKSNLIHVILCSLCHKYSPDEVQIYLLDMKDGVEAFRYVDESTGKAWLPHAKAILASDSPHFAATFLADVIAEMHARNAIFRRDGAANIAEWRHKTKQKMPRILVVADEFTRMFADSDSAKATSSKLFDLLSLGRNAGVHVILATQDTNALTTANASVILSQTSLRLALPNAPGVLASGNNDDDTLSKPQCILNEFSGAAGKNRVFVHPFFDNKKIPGDAILFRKAVAAALPSLRGAVLSACKVVDGVSLETVPAGSEFRHRLGPEPTGTRPRLNLLLGRTDDFATQPFLLQLVGDSYKDHLLVAAPKDPEERPGVWSGLRFSVLQSLAFLSSKQVVFYNPLLETPFKLPAGFEVLGNDIDEAGLRTRLDALRSSKERHKVLVVENFEHAEFLASESSSPFGSTDDGEDTAAGVFRLAFKRGAKAFTTILFTRDPVGAESMLGMSGWDVVAHRIAFGFETASALRSVIKGTDMLDNPGRSVFYSSPATGGGFRTILPFVKPEKGSGAK